MILQDGELAFGAGRRHGFDLSGEEEFFGRHEFERGKRPLFILGSAPIGRKADQQADDTADKGRREVRVGFEPDVRLPPDEVETLLSENSI